MFTVYKVCPYTDNATELTSIKKNKKAVISWLVGHMGQTATEITTKLHRTGKGNYTYQNYTFIK